MLPGHMSRILLIHLMLILIHKLNTLHLNVCCCTNYNKRNKEKLRYMFHNFLTCTKLPQHRRRNSIITFLKAFSHYCWATMWWLSKYCRRALNWIVHFPVNGPNLTSHYVHHTAKLTSLSILHYLPVYHS